MSSRRPHLCHKTKPGDQLAPRLPVRKNCDDLTLRLVLACLGPTNHQFTAKEFLVVQFADGALCFLKCLHLNEGETLGTLIVTISNNLCVLNLANAVEQLEKVALRRIEREITYVETRRCHFDRFRFPRRAILRGLLLGDWR
jgi:hypothetical protein